MAFVGGHILMRRLTDRCVWLAPAALLWALTSGDLNAQTAASATPSAAATTTATSTSMGMGTGMGRHGDHAHDVGHEPQRIVEPDRCGRAGMQGSANGLGMNPMNGVFMNPMAAPYMLGYPMSTNQIGAMMLMNQMGTSGLGGAK